MSKTVRKGKGKKKENCKNLVAVTKLKDVVAQMSLTNDFFFSIFMSCFCFCFFLVFFSQRTFFSFLSGIITFIVAWLIFGQDSNDHLSAESSMDFTVIKNGY